MSWVMDTTSVVNVHTNNEPGETQEDGVGGSSSSGPTPSTGATCPISSQDPDYMQLSEDETDGSNPVWGRLLSLDKNRSGAIDLVNESYTFGREKSNDVDHTFFRNERYHDTLSKKHFQVMKEETQTTGSYAFLKDLSSNGTYVNGKLVGKGKKQLLRNNDEISLAVPKNKVYIFFDTQAQDEVPCSVSERYTLSKEIGRGACGVVNLAFRKGTNEKVAVKIIQKKTFSIQNSNRKQVEREINILKSMNHPCIITIFDVMETEENVYIVLELVEGGELFERIVDNSKLPESLAKLYFYQMVHATKYLHDQGITHRDLKPENVLLDTTETESLIKITDFGLSKFADGNTMLKTFCGTPNYLAPEVVKCMGSGQYTSAIDVWSLGVILYVMLGGYPPFTTERKDMKLGQQIVRGSYAFPRQYWSSVSHEGMDLIKKMMTVNPEKRISLEKALQHEWFKDERVLNKANLLMRQSEKREQQHDANCEPSAKRMKTNNNL